MDLHLTFNDMKFLLVNILLIAVIMHSSSSVADEYFMAKADNNPPAWGDLKESNYPLSSESQDASSPQNREEKDTNKRADADSIPSKIEPLPFLSYDSNTGIGFGVKAFFLNLLKLKESFDLIIFMSTLGERWISFVISVPDFELRQGTIYPLSLDVLLDYDKWIAYNYFGIGNNSKYENRENYTRELREVRTTFSRGFTPSFVGQIALKYGRIESWGFESEGDLIQLPPTKNFPLIEYMSVYINFRYDKRDRLYSSYPWHRNPD